MSFDFRAEALSCAPRVISLLNRASYSSTYGCFDRNYWHFKTSDFPSSTFQMGAEYLARLWSTKFTNNLYYQDPIILQWAKAAFNYTFEIQHKDGSFDEWYPNERGWAGPTSYVCHSLYCAYLILREKFTKLEREFAINGFLKAGYFLIKRDEHDVLANHFALYLLSIEEIYQLTGEDTFKSKFNKDFERFFEFVSDEGWSLEYDGVDFSYNLATLSFFARLHQLNPNSKIENYCNNSLEFLANFIFPNGTLAEGFGSRNTQHIYPYALKYWGQKFDIANEIFNLIEQNHKFRELTPSTQDDHYIFYRLNEYLEVDIPEVENFKSLKKLPCKLEDYNKEFKEAGYLINAKHNCYTAISLNKGAAICSYNQQTSSTIIRNFGWSIKDKQGQVYSSFWNHPKLEKIVDSNLIQVSGYAYRISDKNFSILKLLLFRLVLLLIVNDNMAYYLKRFIRKILITSKVKSNYRFTRKILIEEEFVHVIDDIQNLKKGDQLFWGGEISNRFVPQSNYFKAEQLQHQPVVVNLNNKSQITISKKYYYSNSNTELCVE